MLNLTLRADQRILFQFAIIFSHKFFTSIQNRLRLEFDTIAESFKAIRAAIADLEKLTCTNEAINQCETSIDAYFFALALHNSLTGYNREIVAEMSRRSK